MIVLVVVLGSAFLSMAVHVAIRPARDADAIRKGTRFFLGIGDFLVHWLLWVLSPVERLSLSIGLTPHFFNFAGLTAGVVSGVALGLGELELGGWAIALGGVADIMDGRVARARGVVSPYGKFIDSTLDRFVEVFAFLGLVAYFRDRPVGAFLAAAGLAGSLLVSYAQARGETVGVSGSGGLMQRAERLALMCLACLLDPSVSAWRGWREGTVVFWVLALLAVGTFATAVHRTVWIAQQLRKD